EELESHLGAKKVFQRWDRGCWEDFKKHGVRPTISGGMTLTYPKLWEARIYSTAPNLWKMMSHSTPPLTMIRGQFTDVITSKNWDRVATQMPQASLMEMDGVGHLLPFEKPTEVADLILKLIDTDQS
ncbi:MAG: alpha/beta hydrolase, partial [Bacteroidota bacterium]